MIGSPDSQVAGMLPRLGGRIPKQDLSEEVVLTTIFINIMTAGDIDLIVNRYSSHSLSWCWEVAGLHLVISESVKVKVNVKV